MLIVLSGPSGVGKNRMLSIAAAQLGWAPIVPVTTRARRSDEVHGEDYYFTPRDEFRRRIKQGDFAEWDYAIRNYYGCLRSVEGVAEAPGVSIMHALSRIALRLRQRLPGVVPVYLRPESLSELNLRLHARANVDDDELTLRYEHWLEEQEHSSLFEYVIPAAEKLSPEDTVRRLQDIAGAHGA